MAGVGRFFNSLPGLFLILAAVAVLGALVFQRIEAPNEHHSRIHVSKTRQKIFILAQQLAKKGADADWSKLVAQVDRYRDKLLEVWSFGTDELTIDIPNRWSLWGSIYYCFTLSSTIGYGDIFPSTATGKLLTLLYGLITLPLFGLFLSRLSSCLVRLFKAVYTMTLDSSGVPMGLRDAYERSDANFDFRVPPCLAIFFIYLLCGAMVYAYTGVSKLIKWSTLDAIYFAFVTITTVGFGDLAPGSDSVFTFLSIAYILLGLALTGIVIGRLSMAFDWFFNKYDQPAAPPSIAVMDRLGYAPTSTATSKQQSHPKQA